MSTLPRDETGRVNRAASKRGVLALTSLLRSSVESARSMPMSSSVVVNKAEILSLLESLESALSSAFADSERPLSRGDRETDDADGQAERLLAEAAQERDKLLSDSEIVGAARAEVEQLKLAAAEECSRLRKETDEYVDRQLAGFELSLGKTLEAVNRGRDRLHKRSGLGELEDLGGLASREELDWSSRSGGSDVHKFPFPR